jgi:transcriptional regulator with GAF, ATPase, and Fis domain
MIDLKKVFKKENILSVLCDICVLAGGNFSVLSSEGELLCGEKLSDPIALRIPIHFSGEVICWIVGKPELKIAMNILKHIITTEIEKIKLSHETLEKYKEINILYGLSEKISSTADLKDVSEFMISQMQKSFKCDSGCILMLSEERGELESLSEFGTGAAFDIIRDYHKKGDVTTVFHPEIINNISSDKRFEPYSEKISSIIFVPIIHSFNPLGMMAACSLKKIEYKAKDLHTLNFLAQQISGVMAASKLRKNRLNSIIKTDNS